MNENTEVDQWRIDSARISLPILFPLLRDLGFASSNKENR